MNRSRLQFSRYSSWSSVELLPLLNPRPTSSPPPALRWKSVAGTGKKSTGYCDQRVTSKTEVTPVMFCSNYVKYQHQGKPPALPAPPENVLMLQSCWCEISKTNVLCHYYAAAAAVFDFSGNFIFFSRAQVEQCKGSQFLIFLQSEEKQFSEMHAEHKYNTKQFQLIGSYLDDP